MAVASQIAAVHDSVNKQRKLYLEYRSKYFGDERNPFADAQKIGSLRGRILN